MLGAHRAGDPQAWVCWMDKEEGCSRLRSSLGKGPSMRKSLVCSGYREKLCADSMWTGGWRGRLGQAGRDPGCGLMEASMRFYKDHFDGYTSGWTGTGRLVEGC